jgi:hypothetical protein
MNRLVDVIAARLMEGSLVPYLGPGLHRNPPFPASPRALAEWLAARVPVPEAARGAAWPTAAHVEAHHDRRTLSKLLREAFAARAEAEPLHLLLAGLPALPLVVSAWYDLGVLEVLRDAALAGGRTLAVALGRSGQERPGTVPAWLTGDGLSLPEQADTILFQPLGLPLPPASFVVSEADFAGFLGAAWSAAPVPWEVRQRRDGSGFLFVGCRFGELSERLAARALLDGAPGPHFAVLPEPATPQEGHFLAAEGITAVDLVQERFVAELSRRLAEATRSAGREAGAPGPTWSGGPGARLDGA